MHDWIDRRLPNKDNLSAFLTTLAVAILLVGPMIALLVFMVYDVLSITTFLQMADADGIPTPEWLKDTPVIGQFLSARWTKYLAVPDQLSGFLREVLSDKLSFIQLTAQTILLDLMGRVATLFFALWVLFFFYRDGMRIAARFNQIGHDWLGKRWFPYVSLMPSALRAAVNGLVIVSFAEAVLLSILFAVMGVPWSVLLGCLTATIAFVPMAAPLLLLLIGLLVIASGSLYGGLSIMIGGSLIVILADYLVRPLLIQGGTHLPFLAVLFGVFGGLLAMGIVGLIVGPVLLVLLLVFFDEASHHTGQANQN